ncbi:hypothetical protein MP228_003050 [Amoeboaphelidium protococcarum]|nr:hypothetical protein MP228_003050 [Amoeboaphelidium protococcarum]
MNNQPNDSTKINAQISSEQQLVTLIRNLQGSKHHEFTQSDHPHTRRASVAIILRYNNGQFNFETVAGQKYINARDIVDKLKDQDGGQLDILYIKRAERQRDRWSGHVAFVGGIGKEGETESETVRRETFEELGIRLGDRAKFLCLGRLDDRPVFHWYSTAAMMILSPFVYMYLSSDPHMEVSPLKTEVQDVFWVNVQKYFTPLLAVKQSLFRSRSLDSTDSQIDSVKLATLDKTAYAGYLPAIITGHIQFPAIKFTQSGIILINRDKERSKYSTDYILWGLTLSMTSDLIDLMFTQDQASDLKLRSLNCISPWMSPGLLSADINFILQKLNLIKEDYIGRRRGDQSYNWGINIRNAYLAAQVARVTLILALASMKSRSRL